MVNSTSNNATVVSTSDAATSTKVQAELTTGRSNSRQHNQQLAAQPQARLAVLTLAALLLFALFAFIAGGCGNSSSEQGTGGQGSGASAQSSEQSNSAGFVVEDSATVDVDINE